jgi:ClpP class serine protease
VAQWADVRAAERQRFCERVGAAAKRSAEAVGADLERGRFFSAREAVAYGLLDEVAQPDAEIRQLPGSGRGRRPGSGSGSGTGSGQPPMGFRPLH